MEYCGFPNVDFEGESQEKQTSLSIGVKDVIDEKRQVNASWIHQNNTLGGFYKHVVQTTL